MPFVISIFILFNFILIVHHYWRRLWDYTHSRPQVSFWKWVCIGVGVPMMVWIILNIREPFLPPPLMVQLQISNNSSATWSQTLLRSSAPAAFAIGSCWAAVTFGWLIVQILILFPSALQIRSLLRWAVAWTALWLPLAALSVYSIGWITVGIVSLIWIVPIAHVVIRSPLNQKLPPAYSQALKLIKLGAINEAEQEVLRQLENWQDNFDGWMMLAKLYAENFADMPAADQIIHELCQQTNLKPWQVSIALHHLADWYLEAKDLGAALLVLEEIGKKVSGTAFEKLAHLRINQVQGEIKEQPFNNK